jgi:hypothetical protein
MTLVTSLQSRLAAAKADIYIEAMGILDFCLVQPCLPVGVGGAPPAVPKVPPADPTEARCSIFLSSASRRWQMLVLAS